VRSIIIDDLRSLVFVVAELNKCLHSASKEGHHWKDVGSQDNAHN
jgi:hypothetical protein